MGRHEEKTPERGIDGAISRIRWPRITIINKCVAANRCKTGGFFYFIDETD